MTSVYDFDDWTPQRAQDEELDTVLVAFDDVRSRVQLCRALRSAGYGVIQDRAATQAGRHVQPRGTTRRNDTPIVAALVIAPADSAAAWQLVERLRQADWALPIVVATAETNEAGLEEAALLSVDALLELPLHDDALVDAVDDVVHGTHGSVDLTPPRRLRQRL